MLYMCMTIILLPELLQTTMLLIIELNVVAHINIINVGLKTCFFLLIYFIYLFYKTFMASSFHEKVRYIILRFVH